MRINFEMQVKTQFAFLAENVEKQLSQAVRKAAFDIEARAKTAAPGETGALRASIYTSTATGSNYGKNIGEARARAAGKSAASFFAETKPQGKQEAIVAVGAAYGLLVEMGTARVPARPYFAPAVEAVRPVFLRAVEQALRGGK